MCIHLPAGELFDVFCRFRAHIVSAVLFLLRWLYSYQRLWQLGVLRIVMGEGAIKPEKRVQIQIQIMANGMSVSAELHESEERV